MNTASTMTLAKLSPGNFRWVIGIAIFSCAFTLGSSQRDYQAEALLDRNGGGRSVDNSVRPGKLPSAGRVHRKVPKDSLKWGGKWFPAPPGEAGGRENGKPSLAVDDKGRPQMGVPNKDCDDAQTNLTVDWDFSPVNYTCYHPRIRYPNYDNAYTTEPNLECIDLAEDYTPLHFCMNDTISYPDLIPTYGDHRPLWPMFGEYTFVPAQRWLHNIEHGAVVMLYHPCTDVAEVGKLRDLLIGCFGKHIITPTNLISKERPLALVAWGCRLTMATVDEYLVKDFIRAKALHGPEGKYAREGQYSEGLINHSNKNLDAVYDRVTC